jgi:hypothetical protein
MRRQATGARGAAELPASPASQTLLAIFPRPLAIKVDFNTFTQKREGDNQNIHKRGEMREANVKCKGAALLLPNPSNADSLNVTFHLYSFLLVGKLTRSRKVVAESIICC